MMNFAKKHKVITLAIALAAFSALILVMFFGFIPKNNFGFVDMNAEGYCSDIVMAYDNGEDITKYKNVTLIAEAVDNYYNSYVISTIDSSITVNTENRRISQDNTIKLTIRLYLMTNLSDTNIVKNIFAQSFLKSYIYYEDENQASEDSRKERACLFKLINSSSITKYIASFNNSYKYSVSIIEKKLKFQYLMVITHSEGTPVIFQ